MTLLCVYVLCYIIYVISNNEIRRDDDDGIYDSL